MPNLIAHLKKVAEQKPQATYYNVDMLKYQVNSALEIYTQTQLPLNVPPFVTTHLHRGTSDHFERCSKNPRIGVTYVGTPNISMKRTDIPVSCVCMYSTCVQVSTDGLQSIPLSLVVSWRCEPTSTDLRIDYKYNGEAMTIPTALNNVQFLVPVDGGVSKLQAVLPPAAWYVDRVAPVFLTLQ